MAATGTSTWTAFVWTDLFVFVWGTDVLCLYGWVYCVVLCSKGAIFVLFVVSPTSNQTEGTLKMIKDVKDPT